MERFVKAPDLTDGVPLQFFETEFMKMTVRYPSFLLEKGIIKRAVAPEDPAVDAG